MSNMKSNLKVGLVTPMPPSKTTLSEYGYYLAKHLAEKEEIEELQLYVEQLPWESRLGYEKYHGDQYYIPCWQFNRRKNPFTILSAIKEHAPHIVIINLQFLLFGDKKVAAAMGLLLPMLLKLNGIKCIVLLHNIMEQVDLSNAGFTQNKLAKSLYKMLGTALTRLILKADLVGVTMENYVDILKSKYKQDNVVLLPHGSFETPPKPVYTQRKGPFKVLTFGKFGTYKKVEVLLNAIDLVRARTFLNVELVIAGTDNPNVKGYLEGVQKKFRHVKQVTFTGYVAEEDVPELFQQATVVVFPYTSTTGSSGVLHQAGSYGRAVILTNLGDLASLVKEEGYMGEFFEPEDEISLSGAIIKILTDFDYRKKLERNNFRAASSLSMGDIADWYLIHIEQLLGEVPVLSAQEDEVQKKVA